MLQWCRRVDQYRPDNAVASGKEATRHLKSDNAAKGPPSHEKWSGRHGRDRVSVVVSHLAQTCPSIDGVEEFRVVKGVDSPVHSLESMIVCAYSAAIVNQKEGRLVLESVSWLFDDLDGTAI